MVRKQHPKVKIIRIMVVIAFILLWGLSVLSQSDCSDRGVCEHAMVVMDLNGADDIVMPDNISGRQLWCNK